MIQSISSQLSQNNVPNVRANRALLESQLQQYEKKYSECVHCSSAKTLEGKKNIAEITLKMDNIKGRLENISVENAKSVNTNTHAENPYSVSQAQSNLTKINSAYPQTLGQYINTFA